MITAALSVLELKSVKGREVLYRCIVGDVSWPLDHKHISALGKSEALEAAGRL